MRSGHHHTESSAALFHSARYRWRRHHPEITHLPTRLRQTRRHGRDQPCARTARITPDQHRVTRSARVGSMQPLPHGATELKSKIRVDHRAAKFSADSIGSKIQTFHDW